MDSAYMYVCTAHVQSYRFGGSQDTVRYYVTRTISYQCPSKLSPAVSFISRRKPEPIDVGSHLPSPEVSPVWKSWHNITSLIRILDLPYRDSHDPHEATECHQESEKEKRKNCILVRNRVRDSCLHSLTMMKGKKRKKEVQGKPRFMQLIYARAAPHLSKTHGFYLFS